MPQILHATLNQHRRDSGNAYESASGTFGISRLALPGLLKRQGGGLDIAFLSFAEVDSAGSDRRSLGGYGHLDWCESLLASQHRQVIRASLLAKATIATLR